MKIQNTLEMQTRPSVVMLVYGEGGVGKSTFAASAPKPLFADCENGSKYFGLRGISVDVGQITEWSDMKGYLETLKAGGYETAVIDPVGELMAKLKRYMIALNDSKLVQKDGSPTMAGWGWLKKTMSDYLKAIRDTGLNVILVAHVTEETDEQRIVKRPKIETKLADDLVAMVDIVGYMTVVQDADGQSKRVIIVDAANDKYTAKDRTGQLGKVVEPIFEKIAEKISSEKWVKKEEKKQEKPTQPATDNSVVPEQVYQCEKCENHATKQEAVYSHRMYKRILCKPCMIKLRSAANTKK